MAYVPRCGSSRKGTGHRLPDQKLWPVQTKTEQEMGSAHAQVPAGPAIHEPYYSLLLPLAQQLKLLE